MLPFGTSCGMLHVHCFDLTSWPVLAQLFRHERQRVGSEQHHVAEERRLKIYVCFIVGKSQSGQGLTSVCIWSEVHLCPSPSPAIGCFA